MTWYVHVLVLPLQKPILPSGERVIYEDANPTGEVTIGMVGKYIELPDAYKSVNEALKHAGLKTV